MSLLLNQPLNTHPIDRVKIASLKIEENKCKGQRWIEFWLVLGRLSDPTNPDSFMQCADPVTGKEARYIKLEHGFHPLAPDEALSKCTICGKWFRLASGPCPAEGCGGTLLAYDGWERAVSMITAGGVSIFEEIRNLCYQFLISEEVPDPITWEPVRLLDAQLED